MVWEPTSFCPNLCEGPLLGMIYMWSTLPHGPIFHTHILFNQINPQYSMFIYIYIYIVDVAKSGQRKKEIKKKKKPNIHVLQLWYVF